MARKNGCLMTFLLGGVVVYGVWVFLPRSHYANEAQTILQQARERDRADRELAKDAAHNGYLNPTLLPLWGRKDIEFKPDAEIQQTLKSVAHYSDLSEYKDTNLEAAVQSGNTEILQQFQGLVKIYPQIREAARAQNFLIPYDEDPGPLRTTPNWLALRKVSHVCSGYAELLTLQGKSDEALAVCGDMLAYARQLGQQQGALESLMLRTSIQGIAQQTAAMVLETSKPSPQALSNFAKELQDTQPQTRSFDQAMENQLLLGGDTLDQWFKDPDLRLVSWIPGLVSREKRMYYNDYMPVLIARQKGQPPAPPSKYGLAAWVFGQHSLVAPLLAPSFVRPERHFQLMRKRQGLIHLAVELRLQNAKTLKDLKDYKPLDGFDPAQVQVENGVIRYQLTPEEIALWGGEHQVVKGLEKWSKVDPGQKEWVLR